jgi:hypothetical protein
MNQLYVFSREGYDDCCDLMCFIDRESAMNELIRFAVSTKMVGVIYVYEPQTDITKPMRYIEIIHMKATSDNKNYQLWCMDMSDDEILSNPSLAYNSLQCTHVKRSCT